MRRDGGVGEHRRDRELHIQRQPGSVLDRRRQSLLIRAGYRCRGQYHWDLRTGCQCQRQLERPLRQQHFYRPAGGAPDRQLCLGGHQPTDRNHGGRVLCSVQLLDAGRGLPLSWRVRRLPEDGLGGADAPRINPDSRDLQGNARRVDVVAGDARWRLCSQPAGTRADLTLVRS